ncbi:hypothetical protein HZC30_01315 [Candidatus Woesearchaeota archaeon]|nr:hypothetical protein [Candidatus Woesearchaeota archaeon]
MSFQDTLNDFNQKISDFFSFIGNKLQNFKELSVGEQVSFGCIGVGILLILISIVLFLF